jgi:hypothetical protein
VGRRRQPALVPSSFGTREVFAFRTGVAMPTRMRFRELVAKFRPNSEAAGNTRADGSNSINRELIASVIQRRLVIRPDSASLV